MNVSSWLDRIPKEWSVRRLKVAAPLRSERGEGTAEQQGYVGLENIESKTGRFIEAATDKELTNTEDTATGTTNLFSKGDVLFGKLRPYLAKVWLADREGSCSTEFLVLKSGVAMHGPYLSYALLSPEFIGLVDAASFGSKMPRADWDYVGSLHVPVPPLPTQRRIADYLDAETQRIDELIAAKRSMLALLEKKRAALVSQAVTKGLDPTAKMKDSGLEWLGAIPEHWEVMRVAVLFKEEDIRGEPELPVLTVSLNTGVTLREFSADKIERVATDFNTYKVARKERLVFNKMRFWQGAAGISPVDGLVSSDYTVALIGPELLPPYVMHLMRLPIFSSEVRRNSHGMVDDRLRLYWDGFRDIRIPVPPLEDQEAIVAHLHSNAGEQNAIIEALNASITLLEKRRSALITAAVTGQVEVAELMKA